MKRLQFFVLTLLLCVLCLTTRAQSPDLQQQCARYLADGQTGLPAFVSYKPETMPAAAQLEAVLRKVYAMGPQDALLLKRTTTDQLGYTHQTWQQVHGAYPVFGSVIKTHVRGGKLVAFNGHFEPGLASAQPTWHEGSALAAALDAVGADVYKWQLPGEEAFLKRSQNDPQASYFPKGELTFVMNQGQLSADRYRLAWKFDVYAHSPNTRADVYVDALTGEVIYRNEIMHTVDVPGTAHTRYSGVRTIITDSTGSGYRLHEATHGDGIETYNMHSGTNYGNATDFTDSDNVWINPIPTIDNAALDAHWAIEMTYEYYLQQHNRNSVDDAGYLLRSYVHFDANWFNAQWNGSAMNFGDGNGNPLTTIDVSAHELTHGMTQYSAGLVYQNESGALNESFSDIFGNTVEAWARPTQSSWLIAEDIGAFRSMSNPNQFQNPDTYQGQFWATGTADNGGVHTNSGVQNFWYYLLATGGSGTNDNGDSYNVSGIGIDSAAAIAYRSLDNYLTSNSQFADARFGSIQAAIDLFGECSDEMIQTMNAWAAVGVGQPYTGVLDAAFYTADTNLCALPFSAHFTNLSSSGLHYLWSFGDGTTSTAENPTHNYNFLGTYTVTLIAYGCNGTSDTLVWPNRVIIDINQICPINMPTTGNITTGSCEGSLYDSGGGSNYLDNIASTVTIQPGGNLQVMLTFTSFEFAAGDRITIFDGPDVLSPQIGVYAGTLLPPAAISTSGALTVRESTNGANNRPGFQANWSCLSANSPSVGGRCSIYPNPAHGQLRFEWQLQIADAYELQLFDALGRLQLQQDGQHDGLCSGMLDVSKLAAGVYMLSLQSGDARVAKRVIVE